ncbi:hypothetical protein CS8_096790 [Cupriavidus sp. 8B]
MTQRNEAAPTIGGLLLISDPLIGAYVEERQARHYGLIMVTPRSTRASRDWLPRDAPG